MIPQSNEKQLVKHSYEEVYSETLKYFNGDTLATEVWINKYCIKDSSGNLYEKSPEDMHRRMAKEFAKIEQKYPNPLSEEEIFQKFKNFKNIIPQGSVMSVLGNPFVIGSLSNCIVLPKIYDSYGGIMYTDQQLTQLYKRRCGVGLDISTLRPKGMSVKNSAGSTTGAVSFMERFSNTTREVGQDNRRGALMITIDIAHPDVEEFIDIKNDLKKVTGANISVKLTDEFMRAVKNNTNFTLRFPVDSKIEDAKYVKQVNANTLWNKIIKSAHKSAEPGIIFWDNQHWYSTSSIYPGYENIGTNPCAEIAMNFDSCRLMVVNYYSYVENPFTKNARFNFEELYKDVYFAQRLMDDLVDLELEAVEKIINKVKSDPEPDYIKEIEIRTWEELYANGKKGRRTGLGFTGLGDTLAALGVKYDSDVAIGLIDKISKTKMLAEFESSIDMAIERGAFDGFNPEHENRSLFVQMIKTEFPELHEKMMYHGRRNISISTVAPTGSLSLLTQTSSGIEPVYMIYYTRRRKLNPNDKSSRVDFVDELGDKWQEYTVFHPKFETYMKSIGMSDDEIYNIKENGTKEEIDEIVKKSPYYDATAMDIDWQKRVQVQATVQKYVTHSISSTINLPENVEVKTVGDIYMNAWENKLKGITIYRDGSRSGVLVSKKDKEQQENDLLFKDNHAPKRPKRLKADILRFQNNMEKWIAVVGLLDGRPYEIFTGKLENGLSELSPNIITCEVVKVKLPEGNTRYDIEYIDSKGDKITHTGLNHTFNKEFWNYAKMASAILRHGMPLTYAVELINSLNLADDHLNTWKNGVSRVLKRYIKEGTIKGKCDNCGGENLEFIEGCLTCKDCGSSKCS